MSRTAHAVQEADAALNPVPTLTLVNDCPRALSTDVAAYFGNRHKDVLRQTRNIMDNSPESYRERNFAPTFIDAPGPNGAIRKESAFSMTKDRFTLLAMGFTGPKAVQFKISYIEAFNAMEAELAGRAREGFALDGPSDVKTRRPLTNLINTWVSLAPISYRDAWHQVKGHFQVEKADNLTLSQVKEACSWVQERVDRLGPAHTIEPPKPPKPLLGLPDGKTFEIPDLEQAKKTREKILDAAHVLNQHLGPFFKTHNEFMNAMMPGFVYNPVAESLYTSLDVFGVYVHTLSGAYGLIYDLVNQFISGYELVAALQKGRS